MGAARTPAWPRQSESRHHVDEDASASSAAVVWVTATSALAREEQSGSSGALAIRTRRLPAWRGPACRAHLRRLAPGRGAGGPRVMGAAARRGHAGHREEGACVDTLAECRGGTEKTLGLVGAFKRKRQAADGSPNRTVLPRHDVREAGQQVVQARRPRAILEPGAAVGGPGQACRPGRAAGCSSRPWASARSNASRAASRSSRSRAAWARTT